MEFIGKWFWNLGVHDNKWDILLSRMMLCGIHCNMTVYPCVIRNLVNVL